MIPNNFTPFVCKFFASERPVLCLKVFKFQKAPVILISFLMVLNFGIHSGTKNPHKRMFNFLCLKFKKKENEFLIH